MKWYNHSIPTEILMTRMIPNTPTFDDVLENTADILAEAAQEELENPETLEALENPETDDVW